MQSTILKHPKPLAPTEFHPLYWRCVLQSFLLFLLSYTINACPNLVFIPVGNFHLLCQFLKMMERDLIQVSIILSLLPIISKIFESSINDSLTKHLDITGLFSDLHYGFHAFRSTADILTVLSELSLKVVLDGQSSPIYITNAGVPKGSVLGLTLFMLNHLQMKIIHKLLVY